MHPFLLEELAAARIDELRRQARRERRAARSLQRPSRTVQVARRSLRGFGFLLVRAGLRLAVIGDGGRVPASRRVA